MAIAQDSPSALIEEAVGGAYPDFPSALEIACKTDEQTVFISVRQRNALIVSSGYVTGLPVGIRPNDSGMVTIENEGRMYAYGFVVWH